MRLTLRTLLAYRDHVLKPAELEDMHARVQQSAMAANLLKRIETLVNRPTILAPPIEGKGLGADANSIAEYLDDALKRDKVPELERICLESDVQLGELAQCHHLLSTALSTSVGIPTGLRERIVSFSDPAQRARALAERPTGMVAESHAAPRPTASSTESPLRFRTEEERAREGAAGGEAAASRAGTAGDGRASRATKAQLVEAPMVASGGESIRPTGLDLEGSHLAHEVPEYLRGSTRDRWGGPLAIGALIAVLGLLVWQSLGSWQTMREMFAQRPSASGDSTAAESTAAADRERGGANAAKPRIERSQNVAAVATDEEQDSSTGAAANDSGERPASNRTDRTPSSAESSSNAVSATAERAAAQPPQSNVPHAAEWLPSDPQAMRAVILVYAGEAFPLHRMQAAERLPSGTQVIVPPANRPKLDLAKGPRWTFCGPTQMAVALPETGNSSVPRVDLRLGRALITSGAQGQVVEVQTPDSRVLLTLSDAASRIAIDLSYVPAQQGPVSDRKSNPPVLQIYALDSAAGVSLLDASHQLPAGQMMIVRGNNASPAQAAEAPAWVDPTSDRPVDVLAAEDLQRQLTGNQPVGATLQSLVTNRRPETRSLAAQTLAMLGNWDWVAVEKNPLNDSRDRSYWTPLLDLTRQAIAANPDDAQQLRKVLTARDPKRGDFQTDLWLGFTQAQLQNEGLSAIVNLLDSEVLLDRILAIYQLQRLTGKDFGYHAGEVNHASVQQWKRELAGGHLQINPPAGSAQ